MLPGGEVGGGSSGRAGISAPTTLKDVSRKDRMQRMDQRRMRWVAWYNSVVLLPCVCVGVFACARAIVCVCVFV